jgi:hypothetical protein
MSAAASPQPRRLGAAAALLLALQLQLVAAHPGTGGGCGLTHPAVAAAAREPAVVVSQSYDSPALRRLQAAPTGNGTGTNGSAWVPIEQLDAAGGTASIRIVPLWDVLAAGDVVGGVRRQCACASPGNPNCTVTVSTASGTAEEVAPCTPAMVVTNGSARLALLQQRTVQAAARWAAALRLRPVTDPAGITLASGVSSAYGLPSPLSVAGADLVVIVTARPSPYRAISGFALCRQRDARGRCTVGQLNWCPERLDPDQAGSPPVAGAELHTGLHELGHLLGAVIPGTSAAESMFLDNATGAVLPPYPAVVAVADDPGYPGKPMTWVTTRRVVATARRWIGCDTLTGVPLEELPLGTGAHWDARFAGPELMSYGTGTGGDYLSDLTLAYLEDSGQYVANYSAAGRIAPDVDDGLTLAQDGDSGGLGSVIRGLLGGPGAWTAARDGDAAVYTPPPPPPPGALTWGRNQGCDWWTGVPKATWRAGDGTTGGSYLCPANGAYGCTPDARMAAVCAVKPQWVGRSGCASQGRYPVPGSGLGATYGCGLNYDALSGGGIPGVQRYYASDGAAAEAAGTPSAIAAHTGGNLAAADYLPLWMGYWHCSDVEPASANGTGGGDSDAGGLTGLAALLVGATHVDAATRGGQARCKDCRCFPASLTEMSRPPTVPGQLPVLGQCYRFNCYRPDYLQVGVRSQAPGRGDALQFYRCPPRGGKLYIPGFLGSIHCPPAEAFCAGEAVSGIKYEEASLLLVEVIFWAGAVVAVALLAVGCACPPCRPRLIVACKRCSGASHLQVEAAALGLAPAFPTAAAELGGTVDLMMDVDDDGTAAAVAGRAARASAARAAMACPRHYLLVLNAAAAAGGLALLGVALNVSIRMRAFSFGVPAAALGLLVLAVSTTGACGAWRAAPSAVKALDSYAAANCCLLSYWCGAATLILALLWGGVYVLQYGRWRVLLEARWDVLAPLVPDAVTAGAAGPGHDAQVDAAVAFVARWMWALGGLAVVTAALYVGALVAASRLIRGRTLLAMTMTMVTHTLAALGVLMTVVGSFVAYRNVLPSRGDAALAGAIICMGVYALVTAAVGEVGGFRRSVPALRWYVGLCAGYVALLAVVVGLAVNARGATEGWVYRQSDATLAALADGLNLPSSRDELVDRLESDCTQLAIAAGLAMALVIVGAACAAAFIRRLIDLRAEAALAAKAGAKRGGGGGTGGYFSPPPSVLAGLGLAGGAYHPSGSSGSHHSGGGGGGGGYSSSSSSRSSPHHHRSGFGPGDGGSGGHAINPAAGAAARRGGSSGGGAGSPPTVGPRLAPVSPAYAAAAAGFAGRRSGSSRSLGGSRTGGGDGEELSGSGGGGGIDATVPPHLRQIVRWQSGGVADTGAMMAATGGGGGGGDFASSADGSGGGGVTAAGSRFAAPSGMHLAVPAARAHGRGRSPVVARLAPHLGASRAHVIYEPSSPGVDGAVYGASNALYTHHGAGAGDGGWADVS